MAFFAHIQSICQRSSREMLLGQVAQEFDLDLNLRPLAIWRSLLVSSFCSLLVCLLFPPHRHIPVVHSSRSNLHRLKNRQSMSFVRKAGARTVICSLKKSRSSSQFSRFCLAAESFDCNSSSASSIGYASMTFAWKHYSAAVLHLLPTLVHTPSHRYTSSVGGILAFA